MRSLSVLALFLFAAPIFSAADEIDATLTPTQQQFRTELASKVAALERRNVNAMSGADGWLFLTSELRFLAQGSFWGNAAAKTARHKSSGADPIPAIVDFHRQLSERGIALLLLPVPPKAAIYPDKLGLANVAGPGATAPYLEEFYRELHAHDIDVLDLSTTFAQPPESARGAVYCKTDSHWSGTGVVLAAGAIAERVRAKLPAPESRKEYAAQWKDETIEGDLRSLLPHDVSKPGPENISIRAISEKANGHGVQPDANSPLLVMGDSHTLVFHEFLAERAGLIDQLAYELGYAPDLIGTRGSGATAVRVTLYRRGKSDPNYLAKKKMVIWCFAAREFTETDQGWVQQPIAK
ncbi:MAG: alginate O-acetyltransferase AlgX-related protein [Chthoniobacterales bacterium]